ncbi:TolC family protein [Acidithiobacillus sp. IBUN Pt1247-S3]|uniref:TolC family protein n=1 Tax=Acidithiobacillus sp. IBUN Pt1247-S3 TaxID=3166642 RepID=UPI0034E5767B
MTLQAAQAIALQQNPSLGVLNQKIVALQHQSVAVAQLPDPHLSFGAVNLPTNNFSMNTMQMSMLSIGLSQTFPPFGQLSLKGREVRLEVQAAKDTLAGRSAALILLLQRNWLETVAVQKEIVVLHTQQSLAKNTIQTTLAAYRAGRSTEASVIEAKLALDNLQNDELRLRAEYQEDTARLAETLALSSPPQVSVNWPQLPTPPSLAQLIAQITAQPLLRAAAEQSAEAQEGVRVARTAYLPEITLSTAYGQDFAPGSPNWLSVGVNLSLPIFPSDRQDQSVAAAQAQSIAAQDTYDEERLSLERQARAAFAAYLSNQNQYQRTRTRLVPEAQQAYRATLAAFVTGRSNFRAVLRAQDLVLTTEIKAIGLRQNADISQAELHFLANNAQGGRA